MPGRTWSGATGTTILANMGFEPKGINLSLVMIDKDDKDGRHLAETRLDELMRAKMAVIARLTNIVGIVGLRWVESPALR